MCFGLTFQRRKGGRRAYYRHGYNPQLICHTFLVPLSMNVIMREVVYEMSHTP